LSVDPRVGAHGIGAQHAAPLHALAEISTGDAAVPRLELMEWAQRYGVVAGITARPLSLGLWSDEPVGQVIGRWRAFRAAFGARFPAMVLAHQGARHRRALARVAAGGLAHPRRHRWPRDERARRPARGDRCRLCSGLPHRAGKRCDRARPRGLARDGPTVSSSSAWSCSRGAASPSQAIL